MYYFESKDKKRVHVYGKTTDITVKDVVFNDGKVYKCVQFSITIGQNYAGNVSWLRCTVWASSPAFRSALDIEKNDFVELLGEIKNVGQGKQTLKCEFVHIIYSDSDKKKKAKPKTDYKPQIKDAPDGEKPF